MKLFKSARIGLAAGALILSSVAAYQLNTVPTAHAATVDVTCSNATSDDTTVQNAINSSTVKDIIRIHGACLFDATVKLLDNRTYQGDGRGATYVKMANGSNLRALFATSTWVDNSTSTNTAITFRGFTLDGNKASNASVAANSGVLIFRAWDSQIDDVEVENGDRDGILASNVGANNSTTLSGTSVNTTVHNFFLHDNSESNFHVIDTGNSITDWNLTDGWVAGSGAGFDAVALDNAAGWTVNNLHIYGVSLSGLNLNRCFGTRVTNNYIEDFGGERAANGYYAGINCNIQGDASSIIANNSVNMFTSAPTQGNYYYINLSGTYGTPLASVNGNSIRGDGTAHEYGLSYDKGGATAMTVASTGNAVMSVGTARTVGTGVTVTAGQ